MGRGKRRQLAQSPPTLGGAGDVLLEQSDHLAIAVTPGRLDERAVAAFGRGQCHALALALHDETGWPLYALEDDLGDACHVFVLAPDGRALDAGGACSISELSELWAAAYVEPYTRQQVARLAEDGTWREPALAVAQGFVAPALARYRRGDAYVHPDELAVEAVPAAELTVAGQSGRHRLRRGVWDGAAQAAFADGQGPALLLALSLAERTSRLLVGRDADGELAAVYVELADGRLVGRDGVCAAQPGLEHLRYKHLHAELSEALGWPVPDVAAGEAFLSCWRAGHGI